MDQLTDAQQKTGKLISQLYDKFNKEPTDRRTLERTQQFQTQLEDLWTSFKGRHRELVQEDDQDHVYFTEGYYQQVSDLYSKFISKISDRLRTLTAPAPAPNPAPAPAPIPAPALQDQEQRGRIRTQQSTMRALVKLLNTIEAEQDAPHSKAYVETRICSIDQYWADINQSHKLIMSHQELHDYNEDFYSEIETQFQRVKIMLMENLQAVSTTTTASSVTASSCGVKLPKITLPTFDGTLAKWKPFQDLFTQLIHNEPIGATQKMFYLKANVTGEPSNLIKHLQASEANYQTAWRLLIDRYDNKRALLTSLLTDLLSQPIIVTEAAAAMKKLHDTTKECLLAIQNLEISTTNWDPIVLHLLVPKMDKESRRLYEQSLLNPREVQTVSSFLTFLEGRFQQLEAVSVKEDRRKTSSFVADARLPACYICKSSAHKLFECGKFLKLSTHERLQAAKRLRLCLNCLRDNHSTNECRSRMCSVCGNRHNTLLHNRGMNPTSSNKTTEAGQGSSHPHARNKALNSEKSTQGQNQVAVQGSSTTSFNATTSSQVMLATALLKVKNASGVPVTCRALLDSGSQLNFVSEKMASELGLSRTRVQVAIGGIGDVETTAKHQVTLSLQSGTSGYFTTLEAIVLPKISAMQPSQAVEVKAWPKMHNIKLADPEFFKPQSIDLLLGAEIYFEILEGQQLKITKDLPIFQNTKLGWIVSGKVESASRGNYYCHISTKPSMTSLEKQVQKFWELEDTEGSSKPESKEELAVEQHFTDTVRRLPSGQFVVRLPFMEDTSKLGASHPMAMRRFLSLERKLNKNPEIKAAYVEFMREYEALGHMKLATATRFEPHYFLPHHCVLKPDSSTTKLRVVFDASAKTSSGLSLNDILGVGPTVQPDLFSILIQFRLHEYVITADIAKMYRQIMIDDPDQTYQLIYWREDEKQPIRRYQLKTVTYGTSSAPFLATRCLKQLAIEEEKEFPHAARVLRENTYVDDILTGANTIEEVIQLKHQLVDILQQGHFELRKFCANHPNILKDVPEEHKEKFLQIKENEVIKTLGLIWQPSTDNFQCNASLSNETSYTKRTALSDVARIFDPLGLVGPVTVLGKLFIQELWKNNSTWDEEMPPNLQRKWDQFRQELEEITKIQVPRKVLVPNPTEVQIHVFSDSSTLAYGACCYIRSTNQFGQTISRLLCSKSRVAPLKATTIARLELCGAVLATELVERLLKTLPIKIDKVIYYTDSTTVLAWISKPSYSWKTFVAHRVAKIQALTRVDQWRHIEGTQNPADIISRGSFPRTLNTSALWFNGPSFLQDTEEKWPKGTLPNKVDVPEQRTQKLAFTTTGNPRICTDIMSEINHKNSFRKLQRIIGYCFRFCNNTRVPKELRCTGKLTTQEMKGAFDGIVKNAQRTVLAKEYNTLSQGRQVEATSSIVGLSPFIDDSGIIRVGGRLRQSNLEADARCQKLLPKGHFVNKLLATHLHKKHCHVGAQALTAIIRQEFWIPDVRSITRNVIHDCITCFRTKPRSIEQLMGQLPKERVQPARPFYTTGVDFAGPIRIHYKIRGKTPTKAYIAVFVCFATKAVHLEVVSDLTSEAFINALKRFVARRGLCRTIFCDNATNFMGARSELKELQDMVITHGGSIQDFCNEHQINWKPIPPRSPHFGGLWEAAVKSAKHLLVRQVASASLTYEELTTVITQIEAILNSRPLTPMSSDPNDLEALTPGHFLIGAPLTSIAEPDVSEQNITRLTRYKRLQHIQQNFWKRWSTEYLQQLQTKPKWKTQTPNIEPGTLVLLKDQNLPSQKWPLARVIETHTGSDGNIRVVTVKTASNTLKRAVNNICPLPIDREHLVESSQENTATSEEISQKVSTPEEVGTKGKGKTKKRRFCPINSNWTHMEPNAGPQTRGKTRRANALTSTLAVLMMTSLILPIFGNNISITQFNSTPGIYYENIGELRLVNSHWNMIIFYNMTTYWNEFAELQKSVKITKGLCYYLSEQPKYYCNTITSQIEHQLDVIAYNNKILQSNHQDLQESKRRKRSPLDIIGTIGHSLFGILDAEYAKRMDETIESIANNEQNLRELIINQTSIVESTTNLLKKTDEHVNKQFKMVEKVVNQILEGYKEDHKQFEDQHFSQLFNALSLHATLIIMNYKETQKALLDLMLNVHHGKISPILITPSQITKEIHILREYLPPHVIIPLHSGETEYANFYKHLTVGGRITKNKAIFQVKIPLLNPEKFDIYKIIALPIPGPRNTQRFIQLSAQYLGVNLLRDKFLLLSTSEFTACQHMQTTYLCNEIQPLATPQITKNSCEISLFRPTTNALPKGCKLKSEDLQEWWRQLSNGYQWIYWLPERSTITTVCGTRSEDVQLERQGILQVNAECTIQHKSLRINVRRPQSNILRDAFVPDHDMQAYTPHPTNATDYQAIQLLPPLDDSEQLIQLQAAIKQIKNHSQLISLSHHNDTHQYIVSYLGLILVISGAVAAGIYARRTRSLKIPIPAPRQRTEDFRLKVMTDDMS